MKQQAKIHSPRPQFDEYITSIDNGFSLTEYTLESHDPVNEKLIYKGCLNKLPNISSIMPNIRNADKKANYDLNKDEDYVNEACSTNDAEESMCDKSDPKIEDFTNNCKDEELNLDIRDFTVLEPKRYFVHSSSIDDSSCSKVSEDVEIAEMES